MDAGTMKGVWTSRNFTTVLLIDYILFLDLEEILFMTCRGADGRRGKEFSTGSEGLVWEFKPVHFFMLSDQTTQSPFNIHKMTRNCVSLFPSPRFFFYYLSFLVVFSISSVHS